MHITDGMHDYNQQPRERHGILAIRKRSAEHPMAMFAIFVSVAFAAMMAVPNAGTAFGFRDAGTVPAVAKQAQGNRATPKTDRAPMSEIDIACRGQAWGSESAGCLSVIEKESGKRDARKIRVIANAAEPGTTPNIF